MKFGISGIEKLFDKRLLGKDGWIKLETNSRGRIKKELNKKFSIPGENIKTNLISDVQEYALILEHLKLNLFLYFHPIILKNFY